jgi:pimeloyl-ACP methyl ester carboxylesterase
MTEDSLLVLDETSIAYNVIGQGPWLFLVGAPVGISGFAQLATYLSDRFTVATHDPRGIGASQLATSSVSPDPQRRAADVVALAESLGVERAYYFGASGGAVTLLDLIRQRPDLAERVVIHEAPVIAPLADSELAEAFNECFALAATDPQKAFQRFLDLTNIMHSTGPGDAMPPPVQAPTMPADQLDRLRYELGRMAGPTLFYEPELSALAGADLVITAGVKSHGQYPRRATEALAAQLHQPVRDMPGNHLAPSTDAESFATALDLLLRG